MKRSRDGSLRKRHALDLLNSPACTPTFILVAHHFASDCACVHVRRTGTVVDPWPVFLLFLKNFYRASSGEDDDDRTIATHHHLSIRVRLPNNLHVRTSAASQVLTPSRFLTASDEMRNKHSSTQCPTRHRPPRNPRIWTSMPLSFVGM